MLALKRNQGNLHEDVKLYLRDSELKQALRTSERYKRTIEKARSKDGEYLLANLQKGVEAPKHSESYRVVLS